jgi:hypothetical protein
MPRRKPVPSGPVPATNEINIMHMDFEGQKHPATLNRADRVQ